jgi:hypothetical protein
MWQGDTSHSKVINNNDSDFIIIYPLQRAMGLSVNMNLQKVG